MLDSKEYYADGKITEIRLHKEIKPSGRQIARFYFMSILLLANMPLICAVGLFSMQNPLKLFSECFSESLNDILNAK